MNEINFLIHNLAQSMPLYDRQQPRRVVDLMVEKWAENCFPCFSLASRIVLPELSYPQRKQKH